jgi:hypothetical protein
MKKRVKLNTYDRPDRPRFETNEERKAYIESVTPPKPLIRIWKDEEWFGRAEISLDWWKTREPKVK